MSPQKQQQKPPLRNYAYYSGIGIQMGVIIFLGVWGGQKLDAIMSIANFPLFTILLSFVSVFMAIYIAVRDFLKNK
ncbi:MAG TPA: AtpZ/AtpI family protein [Bacteroidales bacterium]|nr:AtpZ/AtpI family protein [Bacteroidales bacterium]